MSDFIKDWISEPCIKRHRLGFKYEVYESIKFTEKRLEALYDYIAQYILRNYVSPEAWRSINKNLHIEDKSKYLLDKYIPSDTGNFNLRTGEFGEIISRLVFEEQYEFLIYRFHYKENKDEPVKIYDLVGFLIEQNKIHEIVLFEVKTQSSGLDKNIAVKAAKQINKNVTSRLLKYIHFIERVLTENGDFDLYKMINDFCVNQVEEGRFSHKLKVTLVCEKDIYNDIVLDKLEDIENIIDTNVFEVSLILLDDIKTLRDVCYLKSTICYEKVFGA